MAELDRDDDVLEWATRGITQTSGWQIKELYDLACSVHAKRSRTTRGASAFCRAQHERMPSLSAYTTLRAAAQLLDAWETERDAARSALRIRDLCSYIDALLSDNDIDLAWQAAIAGSADQVGADRWLRLAKTREAQHPAEAGSPRTSESSTKFSRRRIGEPTRPPCGSSSKHEPPRPPRAIRTRLISTSPSFANNTVAAPHSSRCSTKPACADNLRRGLVLDSAAKRSPQRPHRSASASAQMMRPLLPSRRDGGTAAHNNL